VQTERKAGATVRYGPPFTVISRPRYVTASHLPVGAAQVPTHSPACLPTNYILRPPPPPGPASHHYTDTPARCVGRQVVLPMFVPAGTTPGPAAAPNRIYHQEGCTASCTDTSKCNSMCTRVGDGGCRSTPWACECMKGGRGNMREGWQSYYHNGLCRLACCGVISACCVQSTTPHLPC
jgi:hypothetical protein